jgi:hypothetical protein
MSREALKRKRKTEKMLSKCNVLVNPNLPFIEDSKNLQLRTPTKLVKRMMILNVIAAYASDPDSKENITKNQVLSYLRDYGLEDAVSDSEWDFLNKKRYTVSDRAPFTWGFEAVNILAWTLGLINDMNQVSTSCDVMQLMKVVTKRTVEEILETTNLKSTKHFLDILDYLYRYNWAIVQASLDKKNLPNNENPMIIHQRLYTLNWVVNPDIPWDEISVDS